MYSLKHADSRVMFFLHQESRDEFIVTSMFEKVYVTNGHDGLPLYNGNDVG